MKQADDPTGYQREDVVSYADAAARPAESDESVIKSEIEIDGEGNVFYIYDD